MKKLFIKNLFIFEDIYRLYLKMIFEEYDHCDFSPP